VEDDGMQYILGLASLFIALLGIVAAQAALAMAVMYGMNKLIPDKLTHTTYGEFDFDHFQKPAFKEFIVRLILLFLATTLALHLLEYLIIYRNIIRHWGLITFALFVLETGGIAAGLYYLYKLDPLRLAIITTWSALWYMMFFALLRWSNLLI
jgi:hypothetical protein